MWSNFHGIILFCFIVFYFNFQFQFIVRIEKHYFSFFFKFIEEIYLVFYLFHLFSWFKWDFLFKFVLCENNGNVNSHGIKVFCRKSSWKLNFSIELKADCGWKMWRRPSENSVTQTLHFGRFLKILRKL